ncbi:MAG: hypothetical protein E6H94_01110 [Chloroflexi bacterium]|nr:MAG: hypothetical protein E6H94_01110 [Chloroflexota bacterium]
MAEHSFVSRRDSTFREYPPASAQIAMIVPFYGDLTVWVRKADAAGWHFPSSGRRAGETILEVARRELWGEVSHLSWWYDSPDKDKVAEVGLFKKTPYPLASDSVELVLEAALRARRTGLR